MLRTLLATLVFFVFCSFPVSEALGQPQGQNEGLGRYEDVGPRGVICCIDQKRKIVTKLWPDGRLMYEIGANGAHSNFKDLKPFIDPVYIAQDNCSRIYVFDRGSGRIYRFNYHGELECSAKVTLAGLFREFCTNGDQVYAKFTSGACFGVAGGGGLHALPVNTDTVTCSSSVNKNYYLEDGLTFKKSWGSSDGKEMLPMCLALAPDGSLYVADWGNDRIFHYDAEGKLINKWGTRGEDEGEFDQPLGIAAALDGRVFVADHENKRVQIFDANGKYIGKFGSMVFRADDLMVSPWGVATAPGGSIYFTDTHYDHVKHLSAEFDLLHEWGDFGRTKGLFSIPRDIAVAPDGSVYVIDADNGRVQQFSQTGKFIRMWGKTGESPGEMTDAYGLTVAPDGSVFVADSSNDRVQQFSSEGEFLRKWGGKDSLLMVTPADVAISDDGSMYVAVLSFNEIQKYERKSYVAQGARVTLRGKVKGGQKEEYGRMQVLLKGEDSKGTRFFGMCELSSKGKYKFKNIQNNSSFVIKLLNFDSSEYFLQPDSITGKATKSRKVGTISLVRIK
ncbi:MAG TPA: hypothetical protein VFI27_03085 [candidate division Zixibacteria bacterium]|nr:hypothetical protein [candidate division Zixibacteria bacterium]